MVQRGRETHTEWSWLNPEETLPFWLLCLSPLFSTPSSCPPSLCLAPYYFLSSFVSSWIHGDRWKQNQEFGWQNRGKHVVMFSPPPFLTGKGCDLGWVSQFSSSETLLPPLFPNTSLDVRFVQCFLPMKTLNWIGLKVSQMVKSLLWHNLASATKWGW